MNKSAQLINDFNDLGQCRPRYLSSQMYTNRHIIYRGSDIFGGIYKDRGLIQINSVVVCV